MASSWIERRSSSRGTRYRVKFRLRGRDSGHRYGGSFATKAEALARKKWIDGQLGAGLAPDLAGLFAEPEAAPLLRDVARRWQASRVDVRESTLVQHRVALGRVLPLLGDRRVDAVTAADVASLVADLVDKGKARESIRKSLTALAMVLDFAGIAPNPARDRVQVRLPLEEPDDMEPPAADHVEAVAHLLTIPYMVALLVLDATGCRVGELEAATLADLDEQRHAWLVRAAVAKTRRARWVTLPDDLFEVIVERLPAREDREPEAPLFAGVTADRLRMAIGRACRDAGVPSFGPHALRHRRVSLLARQNVDWATIGAMVGQRSKLVTADTYTHALGDAREIDRPNLLARVRRARTVPSPVHPHTTENPALAGRF